MKRFALILMAMCIFILPVNAGYWTSINQGIDVNGTNWSASQNFNHTEFSVNPWTIGDGSLGDPYWYHYEDYNAWFQWNNPTGQYYSKIRLYGFDNTLWTCNGVTVNVPSDTWVNFSVSGGGPVRCSNESSYYARMREMQYENGTAPAPIANFTGAPLAGVAPLNVAFTDTSENEYGGCTYNWSITPVTNVTGNVGALENHNVVFNDIGLYNVSHGVSCPAGSNISTKIGYINVTTSTSYVTTAFRATDGATGNRITGATIHLNDVENGSWSNSSTNLGVATITVLVGHHISAYATALGFEDGEYLNAPAMAWTYDIMMLPTGFANVSAGNVTAYITVTDADTLQKLYGAQVNALYATGEGSFILESQTNSAGVASFVLPNNTNVHFTGVKSGYESSQLVLNTGTGSGGDAHVEGELKMSKLTVTPTITQTTLPGGGTPTPTTTVLPGCEDLTTQDGKDRCNAAQGGEMMGFLYENGLMLIELCVAAMIFGLLGMIMKSF